MVEGTNNNTSSENVTSVVELGQNDHQERYDAGHPDETDDVHVLDHFAIKVVCPDEGS